MRPYTEANGHERMRTTIAGLVALTLAISAGAEPQDELFVETIEVNVVTVDVFATDEHGAPVPGLTRDDFELFEAGKPQEASFKLAENAYAPLTGRMTLAVEKFGKPLAA